MSARIETAKLRFGCSAGKARIAQRFRRYCLRSTAMRLDGCCARISAEYHRDSISVHGAFPSAAPPAVQRSRGDRKPQLRVELAISQ